MVARWSHSNTTLVSPQPAVANAVLRRNEEAAVVARSAIAVVAARNAKAVAARNARAGRREVRASGRLLVAAVGAARF